MSVPQNADLSTKGLGAVRRLATTSHMSLANSFVEFTRLLMGLHDVGDSRHHAPNSALHLTIAQQIAQRVPLAAVFSMLTTQTANLELMREEFTGTVGGTNPIRRATEAARKMLKNTLNLLPELTAKHDPRYKFHHIHSRLAVA